jgi:hypothetical protein
MFNNLVLHPFAFLFSIAFVLSPLAFILFPAAKAAGTLLAPLR